MSQELAHLHDRLDRILKGAARQSDPAKIVELVRGAMDVVGRMLFEHQKSAKEPVTQ